MTGLDTGFFLLLFKANEEAVAVWGGIRRGEQRGIISAITLFELTRHGLIGRTDRTRTSRFVELLPIVCRVVWIDEAEITTRAAALAHGNGLAMADAFVLDACLRAGCDTLYTTDADLLKYASGPEVILLSP